MQKNLLRLDKKKYEIRDIIDQSVETPLELVEFSENKYHNRVRKVVEVINDNDCKVVFLAGPSASGKTTTAIKLAEYLKESGKNSITISLDDYLKDVVDLPICDDGEVDYESINTLDIECFTKSISDLVNTKKAEIPLFDFVAHKRNGYNQVTIDDDTVIIVEGLHALNPQITDCHFSDNTLKLYISVKTEYSSDGEVVLNSRNMRLIRRLIRDYHTRGANAERTLNMWKKVLEGENLYIKPFRKTCDYWLDSGHLYEPLIYNHYLTPVLEEVEKDSVYYDTAKKLLDILSHFSEMDKSVIPSDSLLREFIGK